MIVTFLFTDIEGSTKLAQEYPDTYHSILNLHDDLLAEVIKSNNGFVFKKIGDAFCSSFDNAQDSINAAVQIQQKLIEAFKDGCMLKVRIGIHSGEAEFVNGDYIGYVTLSRVQRLMSIAHGGQILITKEVYKSLEEINENKISFKDFGKRKLKDIIVPENVYQIVAENIPADFPPLKSIDARRNNIPLELTSFIGRKKEIAEIRSLLSEVRLLTLIGFGGTGKTRLSIHIASILLDEFSHGVWFVELAKLSEPSYILQEIASALNVTTDEKRNKLDVLTDFLREKEILLILDNCEHLIAECAGIVESLLQNCPGIKIIVTSRESLHIPGEYIYQVPTLSLPDSKGNSSVESLIEYESVRLFLERVTSVQHGFKITNSNAHIISQLCTALEGIPLAIELAAARVKVLPVEKILERLKDRFNLLTGGKRTLLPRQQTMRALIDWSYELLSEKEKLLFQRLSIFSGGWSLEAAEKICQDNFLLEEEVLDLLSNLSDKSLIKVYETEDNTRYTMLETIKTYGDEKLTQSNYKNILQEKHFDFYYKFTEQSESGLMGKEQGEWLKKIALENENIRECLKWSLGYNPDLTLRLSVALGKFWELRSHFTEGLGYMRKSLELAKSGDLNLKAKAMYWSGLYLLNQGNYIESKKYLNECLNIFRDINNKDGEALTLISLATMSLFENDYEKLNLYSEQSYSISSEISNKSYIARNLQNIALGLMQQGKHDEARIKLEESISLYREVNDALQLAKIIGNIGALEYLLSNYDKAISAFEESLKIRNELGDKQGIAIALSNLGSVTFMQKQYEASEKYLEDSIEIIKELGDRRIYVTAVSTLGSIANEKRDFPKAERMFRESILVSNEIGDKYSIAKGIEGIADMLIQLGKFREGCILAAKYISLLKASNKNIIEGELERFEAIKTKLKENLSGAEFEKLWDEGESLTIDEVLAITG